MLTKLIERLRRRSRADPWQLARDAREVIRARTARATAGTLSAAEARRMITSLDWSNSRFRLKF